jgi:hypothetical protein
MATILRGGKPNPAREASASGAIVLHPVFGSGKRACGFGKSIFAFGKGFSFRKEPARAGQAAVVLQMRPGQFMVPEPDNPLLGLAKTPPSMPRSVAGDGMEALRGLATALTIYLILALGALACVVAWRFYH